MIKLSYNSCSRSTKQRKLRKLSLVNSNATLVLVWSSKESWENSHVNSRLSTLALMQFLGSFDQAMKVEKNLTQTPSFSQTNIANVTILTPSFLADKLVLHIARNISPFPLFRIQDDAISLLLICFTWRIPVCIHCRTAIYPRPCAIARLVLVTNPQLRVCETINESARMKISPENLGRNDRLIHYK